MTALPARMVTNLTPWNTDVRSWKLVWSRVLSQQLRSNEHSGAASMEVTCHWGQALRLKILLTFPTSFLCFMLMAQDVSMNQLSASRSCRGLPAGLSIMDSNPAEEPQPNKHFLHVALVIVFYHSDRKSGQDSTLNHWAIFQPLFIF